MVVESSSLGFGLMSGESRCFVTPKAQDQDLKAGWAKQAGHIETFCWLLGELMWKGIDWDLVKSLSNPEAVVTRGSLGSLRIWMVLAWLLLMIYSKWIDSVVNFPTFIHLVNYSSSPYSVQDTVHDVLYLKMNKAVSGFKKLIVDLFIILSVHQ